MSFAMSRALCADVYQSSARHLLRHVACSCAWTRPLVVASGGMGSDSRALEAKILAYLDLRPRATDTATGIATFWVDADRCHVEDALASLVERGVLLTCVRAGKVYYQRA